jgi:proline dehydrogenase
MSIARSLLIRASRSEWLAGQFRKRAFARRAVRRFMPGEDVDSALEAAAGLAKEGIGTVFTALGERLDTAEAAVAVRDHYLGLLDSIALRELPSQISVKLTHLGLDVDAESCASHVLELTGRAGMTGSFVWIDIEESQYVDATLELFRRVRARTDRVGLCLQSYLRRTWDDLESLMSLEPAIRLVKGAYREPPEIAYPKKSDTDEAFFRLGRRLLERAAEGKALPILGTHDLTLIDRLRTTARELGAERACEVHMLYGIRSAEQRALATAGMRVRVLISYGTHWFPWYMRRLAERPANVWFVVKNVFVRR